MPRTDFTADLKCKLCDQNALHAGDPTLPRGRTSCVCAVVEFAEQAKREGADLSGLTPKTISADAIKALMPRGDPSTAGPSRASKRAADKSPPDQALAAPSRRQPPLPLAARSRPPACPLRRPPPSGVLPPPATRRLPTVPTNLSLRADPQPRSKRIEPKTGPFHLEDWYQLLEQPSGGRQMDARPATPPCRPTSRLWQSDPGPPRPRRVAPRPEGDAGFQREMVAAFRKKSDSDAAHKQLEQTVSLMAKALQSSTQLCAKLQQAAATTARGSSKALQRVANTLLAPAAGNLTVQQVGWAAAHSASVLQPDDS